ncbi:MAG: hypothetical protein Q9160_007185 [Pyrenula sp. 1 TL-2023]
MEGRPTKKRRFFVDDPKDEPVSSLNEAASDASSSTRPSRRSSIPGPDHSSETDFVDLEEQTDHAVEAIENGFDTKTFATFVGEDVPDEVLTRIRQVCGNDMERAINMYFDGSWRLSSTNVRENRIPPLAAETPLTKHDGETLSFREPASSNATMEHAKDSAESPARPDNTQLLRDMPRDRYIGAFGVAAWTTKSGLNILQHGDQVRIERTKIAPKTKVGRGGKLVQVTGRNQKADVITRFTNVKGEEIGRLPKETADWVSPLLDQKVVRLEGNCVFAPGRIRVNDTVYLQLRCFLLKTAFEAGAFFRSKDDNRATGIFEEKESAEEKDLRLRQVALVKLFEEISLHPTSVNEMTARHKKEGLLRSAEVAEQYDQDKATGTAKAKQNGTSTPPSEEEDGQELEDDQLDSLYKKAQSFDFETPEAEPPSSFAMSLRKYQRQALHWMIAKEKHHASHRQASLHPLWEEYTWPVKDVDDNQVPIIEAQDKFFVNPYSGELSLEFPVQEQTCLGGILADEMGLGKTIEMMSLIHAHRSDVAMSATAGSASTVNSLPRLPQNSSSVEPAPCTTLVVAPMSLLAQWESESTKASAPGSLKTLVYYGNDKAVNLQNLCCAANAASAPNVIITSYGIVLSEFNQVAEASGNRGSHGGLFSVDFWRVILDEAHTIKNRLSKTAKACYELNAKHRWVLTGTPIVNRLEDLFSLVRFLRVEPWNNFSFWKTFITVPFENKDAIRALNVVQTVLEPLVLRRTKDMKTPDGEALVPLPPRTISIEEVELSKSEREVYDFIFTRAKRAFNASVEAGTLLKSYTTIFAQILRLRQSCCHPILTRNKNIVAEEEDAAAAAEAADANGLADDMDLQELINRFTADTDAAAKSSQSENTVADPNLTFTANALRQIQTESSGECPICSEEPMIDPAVTACWHSACKKCLEDYIDHQISKDEIPRCFSCREFITPRDVFEVVRHRSSSHKTPADSPSPFSTPSTDDSMYDATPPTQTLSAPKISLRRLHPLSPSASTSAKIAILIQELTSLPPNTKCVIFSQFTSFLDLISPQLNRHSLPHSRFDGSLNQKSRAEVLKSFTSETSTANILLLSLRAGGVGLNLTAANRVFMMDPWWSFAVEAQAIDRVHRMGQVKEVQVTRFIVKGSIEERMLRVQERKGAIAGALGVGGAGGKESEEDRRKRRIEELSTLLG